MMKYLNPIWFLTGRNLIVNFIFLALLSTTAAAQRDGYAIRAQLFAASMYVAPDTTNGQSYLAPTIVTQSAMVSINETHQLLSPHADRITTYVVKLDKSIPTYNVHLYDSESKEQFGDVIVVFLDTDDELIDAWKFLPHQANQDSEILESPERNIPSTPPPQPSLKKK